MNNNKVKTKYGLQNIYNTVDRLSKKDFNKANNITVNQIGEIQRLLHEIDRQLS